MLREWPTHCESAPFFFEIVVVQRNPRFLLQCVISEMFAFAFGTLAFLFNTFAFVFGFRLHSIRRHSDAHVLVGRLPYGMASIQSQQIPFQKVKFAGQSCPQVRCRFMEAFFGHIFLTV